MEGERRNENSLGLNENSLLREPQQPRSRASGTELENLRNRIRGMIEEVTGDEVTNESI